MLAESAWMASLTSGTVRKIRLNALSREKAVATFGRKRFGRTKLCIWSAEASEATP